MRQQYPSIEKFKLFGKLGVQQDRELIARYLQGVMEGRDAAFTKKRFPAHLKPLRKVVDELIQTPGVHQMIVAHPAVRDNIAEDILQFLDTFSRTMEMKESQLKAESQAMKTRRRISKWGKKWWMRLMKAMQKATGWKGFMLTNARQRMQGKLELKLEQFGQLQQLMKPFMSESEMWGASGGAWKKVDFKVLKYYQQLMEHQKELSELADMLGRFRNAETEIEREALRKIKLTPYKKVYRHGKEELVGLHESDELAHMLPSEASLLGSEETETIFYKKYLEKKLQTFELRASAAEKKKEETPEEKVKEKLKDRGPVIVCVDTSASMLGKPEQAAKVLTFALLKMALKQKRPCYLVSFSKTVQTIELTNLNRSIDELIRFLGMSFLGGTDAAPALEEAVNKCYEEVYENADVLLISDGKLPEIPDKTAARVRLARQKKNRFFSVTIGKDEKEKLFKDFDAAWAYHPGEPDSLKKIVASLKQLEHSSK